MRKASLMLLLALGLGTYAALAAPERPPAPGRNAVWEQAYTMPNGVVVKGFWRPKSKPGFIWSPGFLDGEWRYIPGHWRPVKPGRPGYVWVPGFWLEDRWYEGHWRPDRREKFAWIPGHWDQQGQWTFGHWQPEMASAAGQAWVPGHWQGETWVEGFWRPVAKKGYAWRPGHYIREGQWAEGRWEKMKANPKEKKRRW